MAGLSAFGGRPAPEQLVYIVAVTGTLHNLFGR